MRTGAETRSSSRVGGAAWQNSDSRNNRIDDEIEALFGPCPPADQNLQVSRLGAGIAAGRDSRTNNHFRKTESFMAGIMPMESSSTRVVGSSLAAMRWMASGMGGPFSARANTKSTASGFTCLASAGSRLTRSVSCGPLLAAGAAGACVSGASGAGIGIAAAGGDAGGSMPASFCASAICARTLSAMSLCAGSAGSSRFQAAIAATKLPA
jgi:hypothetical protein